MKYIRTKEGKIIDFNTIRRTKMNKAIMISIKPNWVADILNGKKTIEIRKTMPKCDLPIDVYIYCTKDNELLCQLDNEWNTIRVVRGAKLKSIYNGKVVAKFTVRKVVPIVMQKGAETGYGNNGYVGYGHCEQGNFKFLFDMEKETCLEHNEELCKYLNNGKNFDDIYINKLPAKTGYAYHIEDLVIFDEPKELSEFKRPNPSKNKHLDRYLPVKVPQSWCYVEDEEQG